MTQYNSHSDFAARRAELMVELFLQDLGPQFISRPPTSQDLGYDLLAGFLNDKGGINTVGVQVKSTERQPGRRFLFLRRAFERLSHSNLPGLLILADVKRNHLYYAWLTSKKFTGNGNFVSIPLTEVNEATKQQLKEQLELAAAGVAAVG